MPGTGADVLGNGVLLADGPFVCGASTRRRRCLTGYNAYRADRRQLRPAISARRRTWQHRDATLSTYHVTMAWSTMSCSPRSAATASAASRRGHVEVASTGPVASTAFGRRNGRAAFRAASSRSILWPMLAAAGSFMPSSGSMLVWIPSTKNATATAGVAAGTHQAEQAHRRQPSPTPSDPSTTSYQPDTGSSDACRIDVPLGWQHEDPAAPGGYQAPLLLRRWRRSRASHGRVVPAGRSMTR